MRLCRVASGATLVVAAASKILLPTDDDDASAVSTVQPRAHVYRLIQKAANHRDLSDKDDDLAESRSAEEERSEDSDETASRWEDFEDTAWVVHGLLMFTSWGLLAPLAIGSSLLRSLLGPQWFKIHLYMQLSVLCLTSFAFCVAVINVQLNDGPSDHFDETHKTAGLAIYLLLWLQVVSGLCRPHLPATPVVVGDSSTTPTVVDHTGASGGPHETVLDALPKKSPQRWFFEIQHRVLGAALVGLAWFNCSTGINEEFGTSGLMAFFGVVVTISTVILMLRLVVQMNQS